MLFYFQLLQRLISTIPFQDLIMNPEINNNNRKNHSKTLAIVGMGFLLIAAAFTFSFANSGQQLVNAQQNQTQGGNATQVLVAVPFDTFTGSGVITASIGQGGQQQGGGGNQTAGGGGNQTAGGGGNQTAGGGGNQTAGGGGGGQEPQYILGGNWNLNAQSGNLT